MSKIDDKVLNGIFEDVRKLSLKCHDFEKQFINKSDNGKSEEKSMKNNRMHLPDRYFQARNSVLTDLFEIKHISTIYRIFMVIFTLLLLNVFVSDFADTGKINLGQQTIIKGFSGFQNAIKIWICMQFSIFCIYPAFFIWTKATRKFFLLNGPFIAIWNLLGVLSVIAYQVAFISFSTKAVLDYKLGPAASMALLMEVVRFMMKSHAFIRSSVPRAFKKKPLKKEVKSSDDSELEYDNDNSKIKINQSLPTFRQFSYFLFAPTLVYRDNYPRTQQIRWHFVLKCFLEVLSLLFILSFLFERTMQPTYSTFGSKFYEIGVKELTTSVFNSMLPGLLCFLCGFYGLLHAWQNAFAELLRFADRMFYLDWWNATNFSVYYRTWNSIVHDWLYLYVYKDLYEHIFKRNRQICQFLVFSISAIFHEYILGFTFRFFYPVLFIEFQGIGVILFFLMRKDMKSLGNFLMWMSLAIGTGLLLSLYHMEYYARENCEYDKEKIINYFIPISWSCNGLKYNKNWKLQF
ncbi:hypothetical protein PVAND_001571 [Polypedilum vanderplanki]|uniref:O-acyltransferase n=1 Tax=Polypedilum vanderplanki TaxID=319348 RepID=A0A9J6BNM0_POLVA|nr:hypothetical protein PVAND_001571 [Polypedilum vanderplanki]